MGFKILAVVTILFGFLALVFFIGAFICHKKAKESKSTRMNFMAAIICAIATAFSYMKVTVPIPIILPLDNETRKYDGTTQIVIEAEGANAIYYSLDGKDPKDGEKYQNAISISNSSTVCARAKFFLWWSDIAKSAYYFENAQNGEGNDGEYTVTDRKLNYELTPVPVNTPEPTESPVSETSSPNDSPSIHISEEHFPNDSLVYVSWPSWDVEKDYGIDGKRYAGGIKISIGHMLSALGDNSSRSVTSRITIPISDELKNSTSIEDRLYVGVFVLPESMYSSKSSAVINIMINNEIKFTTGEMDRETKEAIPFSVNYGDADSIIIETNATLRGADFVCGMVSPKE